MQTRYIICLQHLIRYKTAILPRIVRGLLIAINFTLLHDNISYSIFNDASTHINKINHVRLYFVQGLCLFCPLRKLFNILSFFMFFPFNTGKIDKNSGKVLYRELAKAQIKRQGSEWRFRRQELRKILLIAWLIKNSAQNQKLMTTKSKAIEIIKDRLYWISDNHPPKNVSKSFYFNIDNDLEYEPFYQDFGPLNLGKTWKYVTELDKLLKHPDYMSNIIYHYTSTDYAKAANSAYLMGAFQIIILGYSAEKAFEPFRQVKLTPFRDASYGQCSYKCTLLDCLRGLDYAIKLGWFDYRKFNLKEYEHYERVENGDLNWIIPNKFVAFSSPYDKTVDKYGNKLFSPKDYVPIFKKLGVTLVIRLNNKTYEEEGFTKNGIKHQQLFFTDGTAPSMAIVDKFLQIVEKEKGAVAIHCKAGLGRTGSLIAAYAMKHYHFNAPDFIGWIRIARPGSILGPQQHFLVEIDKLMKEKGKDSPIWKQISETVLEKDTISKLKSMSVKEVEMNQRDKAVLANGDIGQGQYLLEAKQKNKRPRFQSYKTLEQLLKDSGTKNNIIFHLSNTIKMGRMQCKGKGKGISSTVTPFKRRSPKWVSHTPKSIVELIVAMAKKGFSPSQIGVVIRDKEAVPSIKLLTGQKIVRLLKKNGCAPQIPEDIFCLIKKAVNIRKHLQKCKKDKDAKYRLILVESKIHRLGRYYRRTKRLPNKWKYNSKTASAMVSA